MHSHVYPKVFLDAVVKYGGSAGWSIRRHPTSGDDMVFGEKGYVFRITKSTLDPSERIRELDRARISAQIISPTEPWFDFLDFAESVRLAREVNDEIARIADKHPSRFAGLAGIPLNDVDASIEETKRAVKDLGLKGVIVPTKVQAIRAISSEEFDPLFAEFDRLSVPVFIHPTLPAGAERYKEHYLGLMTLYPNETSITIAELIFRGSLEKYPRVKIMVADLGGGLPLMAGRMFRFYSAFEESRRNLKMEPLEYLKKIYYENGSEFYEGSIMCCYNMAGPSKILLGTNHPSPIVAFEEAVESIERLSVPYSEKEMMFYRNAKELFDLRDI